MELGFDLNDYTPADVHEVIPPGVYNLIVKSEEVKPTSKGDGKRLNLIFEVVDGPHKGATIFEGLNIENPSEVAERISRRILKSIGIACGLETLRDSAELVDKMLLAEIGIEPERNGPDGTVYEPRNKVNKYLKQGTNPAQVQVVSRPTTVQESAARGSVAPWAK